MLANEEDARRFHLLRENLMTWVSDDKYENYIQEMSHMLMRDDPVGRAGGDYNSPYWYDVSLLTYEIIVRQLKEAGSSFKEPNPELSHKVRKIVLARWLKKNWPGCEGLVIPESEDVPERRSARDRLEAAKREAEASGSSEIKAEEERPPGRRKWIPWLSMAALLAAVFGGLRLVKAQRA
ncbi:hypothetical protein [Haloferula sargassicola]|uniref:Uncharacterized protein n=1 Tax=Haloferula sargassicola TaxID=490096 RepID=A0ABP9URV6_9BACT